MTPEQLREAFSEVWAELFSSPVHLDSLLSKQTPARKALLAQLMPQVLLRPVALAESLGIGVPEGEPWSLSMAEIARWRPAALIAERLHAMLDRGGVQVEAVRDDVPKRFYSEWEADWGNDVAQSLVRSLTDAAPLSLRVSRTTTPAHLIQALTAARLLPVKAQASRISPKGVCLDGFVRLMQTREYERGDFEIQDEGSQVMSLFALWPEIFAPLLTPTPGAEIHIAEPPRLGESKPWTVVDACAGAGGKSLAIADALEGKGRVYAYDTSDKKLQALRKRAKRMGLNNIQSALVTDGSEIELVKRFRRRADIVLVDAPCSGWGVLRRNPDIKWRQSEEARLKMPELQLRLLKVYSDLVRPGGRLVFGLCTFRKPETLGVVERFSAEHPDFKLGKGGFLGPAGVGRSDGFFMQEWVRD